MFVYVDLGQSVQNAFDQLGTWIPKLFAAIVILVVGWIIARIVGKIAERALAGIGADKALESGPAAQYRDRLSPGMRPSHIVGRIAYWFVFGIAILAAVSALGIQALSDAVAGVVGYLPNVVAALLIMLVAVAVAGAVGGIAQRLAGGTMLGRIVQTAVPALVLTVATFMALVQLELATEIVVATYVLVLGAIALGFALAFGLGGRDVAREMLMSSYRTSQERMPQMRAEAQQAAGKAREEAGRAAQAVGQDDSRPEETQVVASARPGSVRQ